MADINRGIGLVGRYLPITQYPNSVDDSEGVRSERLPVSPPEFFLDPDLQSISQLNLKSLAEASEASIAFCKRIYEN